MSERFAWIFDKEKQKKIWVADMWSRKAILKLQQEGRQDMIHVGTTAEWNRKPETIAEAGHAYVYLDYSTETDESGATVQIPGVKIGDGTSYLIDMPFSIAGTTQKQLTDHISNASIHVSSGDRTLWDSKVDVYVEDDNLFFER